MGRGNPSAFAAERVGALCTFPARCALRASESDSITFFQEPLALGMAEDWRASPASSAGKSESANREVALNCYLKVRDELCVSALTVPPPYRDVMEVLPELLCTIADDRSMDVDSDVEQAFTVVEYDDEGEASARFPMLEPVEVTIPDELRVEPHAKYEAVAPSSTSVQAEHKDDTCPFNIYADYPAFDHEAFANSFDLRAWEVYKKPMEYHITEETARRLHNEHGMDYNAIDRTGITKPFVLHKDQRSGHVSLRHELDLRPSRYWRALPEAPAPRDEDSILDDIQEMFTTFCSLCITSGCLLHRAPRGELIKRNPPLMAREPLVTQGQLKSFEANLRQFGRTRRCGEECWNHPDIDDEAPLPELSPADHRRLESVLECRPDESTCALAIVARLPCFLIYQYRAQKFTSKYIQQAKERSDKIQGKRKKQTRRPKLPPKMPIANAGRLRMVEEDDKGVDDDGAPRPPTYAECDPRRCKSCGASKLDYDRCGNMQMQAERVASIEVKPSKYGLGAFAMHDIRKNQVIGDYTGEICSRLYMDNMHVRDGFAISYIFEFQRQHRMTPVIEGATVGNSTRYINHAPKDLEANKKSGLPLEYTEDDPTKAIFATCEGRETIVDGDLRMLIYACSDIRLGEELRLDYGEDYWKGHTEESLEDTTSMDVDETLETVVIRQRPAPASSKTRRKPGPGRDSEYIPELEDNDDGF
ncbi:SET domain-containing protein [Schizophyllum commune H4-8]|nr:SET domain-containing protein [Schizophyllum commune H4-8]KAI5890676.1 SET domain-containing protein [Schizophyllum commune H4-8]